MKSWNTIIIICLVCSTLSAQKNFTLYGGLQFTDISGDFEYDSEINVFLGMGYLIVNRKDIKIRPELQYDRRSASQTLIFRNTQGMNIGTFTSITRHDYISVPLSIRIRPTNLDFIFFEFAPQISVLLHEESIIKDRPEWSGPIDFFHEITYGLNLGASIFIGKTKSIEMATRFHFGIPDAADSDFNFKSRAIKFHIGYTL